MLRCNKVLVSLVKVDHQLWRLSSHPAIVVLAGNNENEAALATDWYNTSATNQEKEYYYGQGLIYKSIFQKHGSISPIVYGQ